MKLHTLTAVDRTVLYKSCLPTKLINYEVVSTRWFKYDRDYLCVNESQFVPVIFEPPCIKYQEWFSYPACKLHLACATLSFRTSLGLPHSSTTSHKR
jgi:hypothetical protein